MNIKYAAQPLGGRVIGPNRVLAPGPGHGRQDRSMSVYFQPHGGFAVHSFAGDDWRRCRELVVTKLGLSQALTRCPRSSAIRVGDRILDQARDRKNRHNALRIWCESRGKKGTAAEAYLASRKLSYEAAALRFHPSCPFGRERWPAMVAAMTDLQNDTFCGVHRTALMPDGSGKAPPGKMMLGSARSACVKLSADEEVSDALMICEGIETGLALLAIGISPIWALLSAGGLARLPVLAGINSLTIFADNDRSEAGVRAARKCAERWSNADREARIVMPETIGADWADEYRRFI